MPPPFQIGHVLWTDLTVPDAQPLRDFYAAVVGWSPEPVSMGTYEDFNMKAAPDGEPVAGICHARGPNAGLPPVWLIYIAVEDVDQAAARCAELGGEVLAGPVGVGNGARYAVIRDPAGATCALYSKQTSP